MIDLRVLRTQPDSFRASQVARGEDPASVDGLLAADERRRTAVAQADALRAQQKKASADVRSATAETRPTAIARAKELSDAVKRAEVVEADSDAELRAAHLAFPNLVEPDAPPGGEQDFVTLREVGTPTAFEFVPLDHLELGERLGAIDTERGAKVSGARFYFLTGAGALLELGLLQLAMAQAVSYGFTPVITPVLVTPKTMEGTGFLGAHASEVYRLEADDLYLVGTSEVPLAGYHAEEVLDLSGGPLRYAGWSSCFRREAGSYGKDTRGIIRVHQFNKVEMFVYTTPEAAHEEHLRLLAWEEEMLAKVELPYRVIDVAAGDLGTSAARKYDCEAWVPSQQAYREVTSTSNCTTYQARRLQIRYRDADAHPAPCATLNGTLATTRWLVAILENNQLPDGSVRVPEALRPYVGGREMLRVSR